MASWENDPIVGAPSQPTAMAWDQDPIVTPAGSNPQERPSTLDTVRQIARDYRGGNAAQIDQSSNPVASSLPGILGQAQNTASAFQRAAGQSVTANFADEIYGGLGALPSAAMEASQGRGFNPGQQFDTLRREYQGVTDRAVALNPDAAKAGNITGSLLLGSTLAKGGASLIPSVASSPLRLGLAGAAEGALYGGTYGFGEGENTSERIQKALEGGGWGALTGGLLTPVVGGIANPQVSQANQTLNRALARDNIDPSQVDSLVSSQFGPTGVVADLGPNVRGSAAALATEPGAAQSRIVDALTQRQQGANARIASDLDQSLGNSADPSAVLTEIDMARKAVNQQYEPVFRAKALSNDPFIDISPVVDAVDNRIKTTVGGTQQAVKGLKSLLTDSAGNPIRDPQMVMAVRHELDGQIGAETNRTIQGALKEIRKELDNQLGASVPGLKAVDAQFSEIAKQADSLEQGQTILDSGRTAIRPDELAAQVSGATPGQQLRLSQGARAEIDRQIGTKGNDRVALNQILKGEGSWNRSRLETTFGKQKTDALLSIFEREAALAATENAALAGSRTSPLISAKADLNAPSASRKALESLDLMRPGRAAINVADALLGGRDAIRREATNSAVADALMSQGISPQNLEQIMALRKSQKNPVIQALLASAAAR